MSRPGELLGQREFSRESGPGLERALNRALVWTIAGGLASVALLAVPQGDDLLIRTIVHLSVMFIFGFAVAGDLAGLIDQTWFVWLRPVGQRLAAAASVVVLTVGVVALVTLASSAALRLAPSLQFLQLISAMDIAWVVGATFIGVGWLAGRRSGALAGAAVGVVCVWSIWRYLVVVGFAPDGGWLVDGAALLVYVLPYDMAAAIVAVTVLWTGARRRAQHASI